jgi:hypothetical protein
LQPRWAASGGDSMKTRYLGAASALVLGLAICGAAAAQTATNTGAGSATNNVTSIPGLNNNSLGSGNNNSNQGNDTSNNSNQNNDQSQTNGNSLLSGNSLGNGNDNSNQDNNYSNNSNQSNTNVTTYANVPVGSYNQTGSNNMTGSGNLTNAGSFNSFSDTSNNSNQDNDYSNNSGQNNSLTFNVRLNLTSQDLGSSVSGVSFNGSDGIANGGSDNRSINSGAVSFSGGAYQGWAGIQTASTNTGIASNNLATTAVSANANVNFGGGNAGSQ